MSKNYTRKVGRPTKYDVSKIEFVENYIKECKEKSKLPVKEELAYLLDVDTDTLLLWEKKHKKFIGATKKLMEAQRTMLQQGIYDDSKQHGAGGIFLLKNNHHFTDQQQLDVTSGGKPLPTPIMSVNPNVIHPNNSDS